jgi:hypothetical protein
MAILGRILVLTTAVLLALPTGWCCSAPAASPKSSSKVPPCCRTEKTNETRTPACPAQSDKCCCRNNDKTEPPAKLSFAAPLAITLDVLVDLPAIVISAVADLEPSAVESPPPRHLLLCVWLC